MFVMHTLFRKTVWLFAAAVVVALATTAVALAHPPIDIVAANWKFTPAKISIPVNQPTTLHLTSSSGVHGIESKELGIELTTISPGKPVDVTFTPKTAGTYVLHCAVVCGPGHGNMTLTIEVTPLAAVASPVPAPSHTTTSSSSHVQPMPMGSAMPGMTMNCVQMHSMMQSQMHSDSDKAMMQAMMHMHRSMLGMKMTGNPDHDFLLMMIPHHQSAIDVAQVELRYGKDPRVRALAASIISAQQKEIDRMRSWLSSSAN
jgi:uncharacterized protein (DUF305 family)